MKKTDNKKPSVEISRKTHAHTRAHACQPYNQTLCGLSVNATSAILIHQMNGFLFGIPIDLNRLHDAHAEREKIVKFTE